jgi:hypothetical protein
MSLEEIETAKLAKASDMRGYWSAFEGREIQKWCASR